jgi:hypothetical protein
MYLCQPKETQVTLCLGCNEDKPIKAKGLCRNCYAQFQRTGSTVRHRMKREDCTVEGCDKPAHGRGLCHMHLKRFKMTGTTDDPRGDEPKMTQHKLYSQWSSYKREGAYTIVPEWRDNFFAFLEGVGERPSLDHRLYRLDKTKPMGPGNFEWRAKLVKRLPGETDEEYQTRYPQARRTSLGTSQWENDLRRRYGIGVQDLRTMAEAQDHKCAICGKPEQEERGGYVRHLAVDHDHATGKVRELLCQNCNKMIGYAKDDPLILARAIAYLAKHKDAS